MSIIAEGTWNAISVVAKLANLYGLIHDTKDNPLPAVLVGLDERSTATLLNGTFSFLGLDLGDYTITCAKAGYQDFTKEITLVEGANEIDIEMLAEGEAPPEGIPWWQWAAIGGGVVALIGIGVALVRRKKE